MNNKKETAKSIGCLTLAIAFLIACNYGGWTWFLFFILLLT